MDSSPESSETTRNQREKHRESPAPRDTATPSPSSIVLHKSSSSSSLLLPENKKDSPTKTSRFRRSVSGGSLRRSPTPDSKSSTPIGGASPTFSNSSSPPAVEQDTATILESLEVAEKEQEQEFKRNLQQEQKKTLVIPASTKDSPKTPEGEKRSPRLASPVNISEQATMERLERICASPISVDSRETTTHLSNDAEQQHDTKSSSPRKSSSPPKPFGASSRIQSLQWHEAGPQTSSRVITSREPSRLLPSPPSIRIGSTAAKDEVVAVFNANTSEGKSMVRALAKSGSHVVAIVRVFTSRNTKSLLKLGKNVVVKVADSHDEAALAKAVEGADRAFLVTTFWDRFDSTLEEKQAIVVLDACASQNVRHLVLSSFEDTKILKEKGLKSQIVPRKDGTITPNFDGMKSLEDAAKKKNVQLTHMMTSYLDQEHSKKSLCLIVGENGNLIVNSHIPEEDLPEI